MTRSPPYSSIKCPICGAECPCVDWCEVDIGVGTQTFDPSWGCPQHGEIALTVDDGLRPARWVFRDLESPPALRS